MGLVSRRKVRILILIAICVAIILITIAYAYYKEQKSYNTWDIHFEDLSASTVGKADYTMPVFSTTILTNYSVSFKNPGDSATFQFKVVNGGNLPARLSSIVKSIPRCAGVSETDANEICDQLVYTILNEDGTELKEGELLAPKSSKIVKVLVEYPKDAKKKYKNEVHISNLDIDLLYQKN